MTAGQEYDKTDPLYYDQFFGLSKETSPCEATFQDNIFGEYIAMYGKPIDIYLCSHYDPIPVFGEDPVKRYEVAPFTAKGMWDLTAEKLSIGSFDKTAEQETILITLHKTTVRDSIKTSLLNAGLILEDETIPDESGWSKYERHRRELQEGDIIRLHFNNIHYEIDGIKEEPEYQPLMSKYIYQVYAKPRLVSGEELGVMQPVTDAVENQINNANEIQIEADKILF